MDQSDIKQLNENLEKLNKSINRQLSWKFIITKGVVYGLGTIIGTTIVAGLVFSFLRETLGL